MDKIKQAKDRLSEDNADLRKIKIDDMRYYKAKKFDILRGIGVASGGALVGGTLGKLAANNFTKKLKARIAYINSKGTLATPNEYKELRSLTNKLKRINTASIASGAILGGITAHKVINPKLLKDDRKEVFRTK